MKIKWTQKKVTTIIIAIGVILFLFKPVCYWISAEDETITIKKTERISNEGESYYLVFTEDGVYKNVDSWLFLKFNSSDVQGQLEEGKTYNVKVAGWRISLASMYENIIKVYGQEK